MGFGITTPSGLSSLLYTRLWRPATRCLPDIKILHHNLLYFNDLYLYCSTFRPFFKSLYYIIIDGKRNQLNNELPLFNIFIFHCLVDMTILKNFYSVLIVLNVLFVLVYSWVLKCTLYFYGKHAQYFSGKTGT